MAPDFVTQAPDFVTRGWPVRCLPLSPVVSRCLPLPFFLFCDLAMVFVDRPSGVGPRGLPVASVGPRGPRRKPVDRWTADR